MSIKLHFHGAAGGVTGSCFRLQSDQASVLIDCGLFQGPKTLKELNYRRFPFDPEGLDAVLLTHAHVDHSGLLPKLMLAGFSGPIHATAGTRELCNVMLADAGGIQEHEVEQLNRRFQRRGRRPVEPIYTADDARDCMRQFSNVRYDDWIDAAPGLRARWWDAGHILGSASIEVEVQDDGAPLRLLFSGDIGPGSSDFAGDPQGPVGADHLIVESTYGKAERPRLSGEERRRLLGAEVKAAHEAGGPLLIPAFAVERTQELIADLIELMQSGAAPPAQIFLDSPLAVRASEVFFRRGRNAEGANPFASIRGSSLFHTTESVDESEALEQLRGWHIIIAASGMCDAGRVRHHLNVCSGRRPPPSCWSATRRSARSAASCRRARRGSGSRARKSACTPRSAAWTFTPATPTARTCWRGLRPAPRSAARSSWSTASPTAAAPCSSGCSMRAMMRRGFRRPSSTTASG